MALNSKICLLNHYANTSSLASLPLHRSHSLALPIHTQNSPQRRRFDASQPPRPVLTASAGSHVANAVPSRNNTYTVGDFMTTKENLLVVKPTTTVDEGGGHGDASFFPSVDSSWRTFNELQRLLVKTNGKVVGDLMTSSPLVVHETTNLEEAARLLLETRYRRLPVVDEDGKLVGLITRGGVVRAALQIKRANSN